MLEANGSPRVIPDHSISTTYDGARQAHSQALSSLRTTDLSLGSTREAGGLSSPGSVCVCVECGRGQGELYLRAWGS